MSEYQLLSQKLKRRMMNWESYLHSFMILCCLYAECEGVKRVEAFLGETTNFTAVTGESIEIECKYRSGQIDQSKARQWYENSKLIISDGTLADPNSGYSENLKSDSFMLTTPPVNITFDGYKYTCIYEFDQSYVYLNVIEDVSPFEGSKGDRAKIAGTCPVILIVFIVTVPLVIFLVKNSFEKKLGGFLWVRIPVFLLYNGLAFAVGFGLGFGFEDDQWGYALGLSFLSGLILSAALVGTLIIINQHCPCNSKNDTKDSRGPPEKELQPTDRSNGARSATSASGVEIKPKEK